MKKNQTKLLKTALSLNFLIGIPMMLIPEQMRSLLIRLFEIDDGLFLANTNLRLYGIILTLVGLLLVLSRKLLPQKLQDILIAVLAIINSLAAFELFKQVMDYQRMFAGYIAKWQEYGAYGLLALSLFVIYRAVKYLAGKYLTRPATKLQ
jgi:hypothetical protein